MLSPSIKETMIAMNNGINDISTAMNDSAQGVTSVAEDISELANAISLIKDKSDDNKEISEELLVEISRFTKIFLTLWGIFMAQISFSDFIEKIYQSNWVLFIFYVIYLRNCCVN